MRRIRSWFCHTEAEAQGFGLLEEARPPHQLPAPKRLATESESSKVGFRHLFVAMALVRMMALCASAYFCCQYLVRYGPAVQQALPAWILRLLVVKTMPAEQTWSQALSLSAPYGVLVVVFAHDLLRCKPCQEQKKMTLSQLLFERLFGVHGCYHTFKVAALQLLTILLQACGKLRLLAGIVTFAMQQEIKMLSALQLAFWCFWSMLALNALYPTVLFLFPGAAWARYGAAVMDVILDLGYMLSYMILVDAWAAMHRGAEVIVGVGLSGAVAQRSALHCSLVCHVF